VHLDDIDWALLDQLQRDGRTGFRGYRAMLDPRALGLPVLAFVRVSGAGGEEADARFMAAARGIPEIREVHRVTGAETYLMRVQVKTVQDLERVIRPLWKYGDTVTGVVMSVPIADRPLTREMVG
jgi:Lrp/AsnC family leucine-responsive transcriptional regulator